MASTEKQKRNRRAHTARRRLVLNAIKSKPCTDCGHSFDPVCMDFDHRDPSTKKFTIASNIASITLEVLLDEIAKCDIVCANCHRLREKSRRKENA